MNKDEILAKSKLENRGMDMVNLEVSKNSMQVGWVVLVLLLSAAMVITAIIKGRMSLEISFSILAGSASVFGYKYMKLHKKHELIVTILYGLGALACLIGWIIQLTR
ncbi:MAG: hypothetical protein J6Y48_19050 [Clostridia bacterium]|nr:hypothetical protein [Clostridia bacterium]